MVWCVARVGGAKEVLASDFGQVVEGDHGTSGSGAGPAIMEASQRASFE